MYQEYLSPMYLLNLRQNQNLSVSHKYNLVTISQQIYYSLLLVESQLQPRCTREYLSPISLSATSTIQNLSSLLLVESQLELDSLFLVELWLELRCTREYSSSFSLSATSTIQLLSDIRQQMYYSLFLVESQLTIGSTSFHVLV